MQESVHKLSRVAFWGHTSTPVKHKHMLFPPACSSSLINEDLPSSWPGQYMKTDSPEQCTVCTAPQSVRYHKLPPPCDGLLPASQGYMAHWSKVYVCWSVCKYSKHSPEAGVLKKLSLTDKGQLTQVWFGLSCSYHGLGVHNRPGYTAD